MPTVFSVSLLAYDSVCRLQMRVGTTHPFIPADVYARDRGATAGELTLRDLKDWISEREDVAVFLSNFIEARMIISSLEVSWPACKYPVPFSTDVKARSACMNTSHAICVNHIG